MVKKAKEIKEKHPNWEVKVISLTVPFKVPNKPKPSGHDIYWCPYCRGWYRYHWDEEMGLWVCPVCGISTRDYYVRQSNGGSERVPW
jgi:rubrerythrin